MGKLERIKLKLILRQPFFGNLIIHTRFKLDDSIESISTNGIDIFYNKDFVEDANEQELTFLVLHQLLHIILLHVIRSLNFDNVEKFHKASDLVANSIALECFIDNEKTLLSRLDTTHTYYDTEASLFTVEQLYQKIKDDNNFNQNSEDNEFDKIIAEILGEDASGEGNANGNGNVSNSKNKIIDDHKRWEDVKNMSSREIKNMEHIVGQNIREACMGGSKSWGDMPASLRRVIKETFSEKIDWKTALQNFVETEITDYSFNPPDKRNIDSYFLLPDFNETDDKPTGVFFFIDVSGSMSEEQVADCKAEVRSCIRQYNNRVEGFLGYFDYEVSNLKSFDDEESMVSIEALGGGGTSFTNVFKYLDMHENEFECDKKKVIILTDGYAEFPSENDINVDEVLWIINNDEVTPPFGEVIRI